jgi:hypothetical protein
VKRGIGLGVLVVASALAAARPAGAADKDAVNAAIERGRKNLLATQVENGTWSNDHTTGLTALCGLTLLECGTPVDDGAVQKAAAAVRSASVTLEQTYDISLSILFLDRLGEPVDVALIESLTVRLLAGQTASGCWTYACPNVDAQEHRRLKTLVEKRGEGGRVKEPPKEEPGQRTVKDMPQEIQNQLNQVARNRGAVQLSGDNSNTQFAVLALWVARRHGLPVDTALNSTERYFRNSVYPEGGWAYVPAPKSMPGRAGLMRPPGMTPTPAMTCAGLLGIGLAYGAWNEAALHTPDKKKEQPKHEAPPVKSLDPSKDELVKAAFKLLGAWVDGMRDEQTKTGKVPQINRANGKFYYFLWSLERIGVAYGVDKVGRTDWYDWGAEILLANQGVDGGWNNGEFGGGPDTCFALLFLKRANLVKDLTSALKTQMKDGMQAALHQGGVGGAELLKGRTKPFFNGPTAEDPDHKPAADDEAQAARLGKQLAAGGDKVEQALKKLQEGKGAAYTDALARAIPQLEGDALKKAREALAERLSGMTLKTLEVKLDDEDPEVRRAAALAVATKEGGKVFTLKLIDMLSDKEATVGHAAHAALKELTREDFGPAKGAAREERAKAILAWKAWWAKQQGDK